MKMQASRMQAQRRGDTEVRARESAYAESALAACMGRHQLWGVVCKTVSEREQKQATKTKRKALKNSVKSDAGNCHVIVAVCKRKHQQRGTQQGRMRWRCEEEVHEVFI